MALLPPLRLLVTELSGQRDLIAAPRRALLDELRAYVAGRSPNPANLTFICTHNSRRSHLGMIWGAVAAYRAGRDHLRTFSGGTEVTALNPRMVAALRRAGFGVHDPGGPNPHYEITFADDAPPLVCFSKRYDHPANPADRFAAVMTCDHADANCPFIPGAEFRLALPYADPKAADDTPEETARYDERLRDVGRELLVALG